VQKLLSVSWVTLLPQSAGVQNRSGGAGRRKKAAMENKRTEAACREAGFMLTCETSAWKTLKERGMESERFCRRRESSVVRRSIKFGITEGYYETTAKSWSESIVNLRVRQNRRHPKGAAIIRRGEAVNETEKHFRGR